jgi:ribosome-binding protein aMBF1 (putative translation factor)
VPTIGTLARCDRMQKSRKPGQDTARALREHFAANLRHLRLAAGLTQRDVAARALVPQQYVSRIEQAAMNITLGTLAALSESVGGNVVEMLREAQPGVRRVSASRHA